MRRLGLVCVLAASACFDPSDPSGDTDAGSSSSGSTNPTSASASASASASDTNAETSAGPTSAGPTTDGPTTDGPTTDGDTSTTSGSMGCGDEETCVESAPAGWDGPGLRITGESGPPPTCGMDYAIQGPGGFTGAMAPPADCDCSCDLPAGFECPAAHIVYYSGNACAQGEGANDIAAGECGTFFIGQGIDDVTAEGVVPDNVECEPSLDETIPPVGPTDPTSLCLPESFGSSCGETSTCLPAASENTYCIAQEGDVPCPADSSYDARTVIYGDFEDTRECGPCSCGGADVECGGFLRAYSGDNCTGGFITVPIDGSCEQSISDIYNEARYFGAPASGGCPAGGGASEGDVTPLQPTTLCCAHF